MKNEKKKEEAQILKEKRKRRTGSKGVSHLGPFQIRKKVRFQKCTIAESSLFRANFVPLDDEVKVHFFSILFQKVHSSSDLERKKKCTFPMDHQFLQKLTFLLHSKSRSKVHVPGQAALFKVHFPPRFGTALMRRY